MKTANQFMRAIPIHLPGDHQFSLSVHQAARRPPDEVLPIQDSLKIKAAEYWLKLGEADQALRELEALPSKSWKCGWALRTRIAAMGALRGRDELTARA